MSELAAELSHDLRVPLSTITASVDMLEDELGGHSDATVGALLGTATRAGDRMARMLDQNMTPPTREPTTLPEIDLAEIVRQLLLDSAAVLELAGAVVETGELPVVRADPDDGVDETCVESQHSPPAAAAPRTSAATVSGHPGRISERREEPVELAAIHALRRRGAVGLSQQERPAGRNVGGLTDGVLA